MTTARRAPPAEWLWTLAVVAVVGVALRLTQPVIPGGVGNDGGYYLQMAEQIQRGAPPETIAPFVWRAGTPWLAQGVAGLTGAPLPRAFFMVNIFASIAAAFVFAFWLRSHVPDLITRLVLVVFYLIVPYSPFRFTFYYPVLTDPMAMLFMLLGLVGIDAVRARSRPGSVAALTLIVLSGCVFREVVLVIGIVAMLVRPRPSAARDWFVRGLPLVGGVLAIVVTRSLVLTSPSSYSMVDTVMYWLQWKTAAQVALAALFVFGPLSVLLFQYWKIVWPEMRERPDLSAYLVLFVAIAWLGASDTERLLMFAAPVWLMCVGKVLARIHQAGARLVLAAIVIVQLLAYRAVVPIGDAMPGGLWERMGGELLVAVSAYDNFFSLSMRRPILIAFLGSYTAAMLLVAISVRVGVDPAGLAGARAIQMKSGRVHG